MEATTPAGSPIVTTDRLVPLGERASDPDHRPTVHAIHAFCHPALAAARLAVLANGRRRRDDTSSANQAGSPRYGGALDGGSTISGKEQPSGGKTHA